MIPFKVYDRERKEMLVVLNFHPTNSGGTYLVAKETDNDADGALAAMSLEQILKCRLVDFVRAKEE